MANPLPRSIASQTPFAMVAVSLVLNSLLVWQNAQLRRDLGRPANTTIAARVTNLTGVDLSGQRRQVKFERGRRYLVFTFSARCDFCRRSVDEWMGLARQLDRATWSVIWVSRDELDVARSFVPVGGMRDLVLADVPHRLYAQLGLAAVPQSIVLSSQGEVVGAISGEMNPTRMTQLSNLVAKIAE